MHDALLDGRAFRVLIVVDQWSRESPLVDVQRGLSGRDVVRAFEARVPPARLPKSIPVDHGTEFTSTALEAWAFYSGVTLDFTRPGKATNNGHIESFNGRLRDGCVNGHHFLSIEHARNVIEGWRRDENEQRPHNALGGLTPTAFARHLQASHLAPAG